MTIALESEIVGSAYDPVSKVCTYTIERNGKRWTAEVPVHHLQSHKGGNAKMLRRNHVAKVLEMAMQGEPDVAVPKE
jgi:hypothetical protein